MGIYKTRTDFINKKLLEVKEDEEKRLLAVGFIPDSIIKEYEEYIATNQNKENDTDYDKTSNNNYLSLNTNRISGKIVKGSGFLNPTLTKGTIQDVVNVINSITENEIITENNETKEPIMNEVEDKPIIENVSNIENTVQNPKVDSIKTEVDIESSQLEIIVSKNLLDDDISKSKSITIAEAIKKYNDGISEDEIKAWVYFKRKYGNPMKGWESYFLKGGKNEVILIKTTQETTVKDNAYRDLRVIPANTILGVKTKFKNTYGTESLIICRTEQGELLWINIEHIKEIKNKTSEQQSQIDDLVTKGALIYDGVEYYPVPVFCFGNIYEKIETLNERQSDIVEKYGQDIFDKQLALVNSLKPKMKSFREPVKSNRPHILCLSAFANDFVQFGIVGLNEEVNIKIGKTVRNRFVENDEKISLFDAFKFWFDESVKDTDLKNTTKSNIKKYYLANSIRWEKDDFGKDVLTQSQKDELIGNARIAAEDVFSDFLATALTYEDAVALDNIWNAKYNSFTNVLQFVNKIPIAYDGSSMFKDAELRIKPAQRQGLAYLQLTGSGCLAHDVGYGKTITAILNMAQLLSQGAVRRPLVVVPKPVYKNWLKEMFGYWTDGEKVNFKEFEGAVYHYGVFSGTDIKINDWYNLSGKHYEMLLKNSNNDLNKLVPNDSITIVSYKGFEQMGLSSNVSDIMFESISKVIMQKESGDPKEAAKQYEKIQEWLGRGNRNSIIDFDKCGFDHITIDEAHNFKNVFNSCGKDPETGRKLFGISSGQSSRAVKMFFITNYLQATFGKKVVLLTATPFTNSPLEMYSMLSFIGLEALNQYNLYNIKKFFEQFVLETIEYAIDAKGEIVTKPVIKSYMNLKLLQTILYNHFHYKDDPKEAEIVRPCMVVLPNKDINTYIEMNEWQKKNQLVVKQMARSVSRTNQGAMLKAINMSLDNAFSPYLFAKEQPESSEDFVANSPKIHFAMECIRSVKEWHEGMNQQSSGMVIYANRGKNYFQYIKEYLLKNIGYKKRVEYDDELLDEVEIIEGGGGESEQDRKELVKDAFNAGVVKIIIGTSTIREGVNLQKRGTCLFDLYPEWNPTDIQQLQGRIWRQGNIYGYVRFVMPLVINSMDNFVYQKQDEKSSRISSIWHTIGDVNISENTSDLNPSEVKYELVDDVNEKFKIKYDTYLAESSRDKNVLIESKDIISDIAMEVNRLKDAESSIYSDLTNKSNKWIKYLDFLKGIDLKILIESDRKKTADNIKLVIKNVEELINAFNIYISNRNDIPSLMEVNRMLQQRTFDLDYATTPREMANHAYSIVGSSSFDIRSWDYNVIKSAYSSLRKAEKSVLSAYGKSWYDDISDIRDDINKRAKDVDFRIEYLESEQFKNNLTYEIERELEAKRELRGDLETQVGRFSSLNHLLSYLSDNTDRENCPIPLNAYDKKEGINVVFEDKSMEESIEEIFIEKEQVKTAKKQKLAKDVSEINEDAYMAEMEKKGKKIKLSDIPETLKTFMPEMQQKAIVGTNELWSVMSRLNGIINKMPKTYETEDTPTKDKIVWLHYFYGQSDWYIVEKDMEEEQLQAFGYVVLNGDLQNAELGYISIEELKETNEIQLDFYFDPITFKEIHKQLFESEYENQFEDVPSAKESEQQREAEQQIEAEQRQREVELELETEKQEYLDAIEGLSTMLDFVKGKEKKEYIDAIEGLKTMLELMD